jgi:cardiolipin synthase
MQRLQSIGDWIDYFLANSPYVPWAIGLFYFAALACAVREVMNSRTSQGSIAWIMSLLLLPFPTVLLYLVFGMKAFDGYAELQTQTHVGRRSRAGRTAELAIMDGETSAEWPVLTRVSEMPFLSGNEASLLIDGDATFRSIFGGISRAESYILIQFYIVRDDALGRALSDHLIDRAKAGVSVRLLYDDIGSTGLPRAFVKKLRKAGVHVSTFNQRHRFLRLFGPTRINYRTHRKIVVVDGTDAWVGGHNVGVEYLGQDPRFGRWRDTHVHVRGPAALASALVFREDWHWATGEILPTTLPKDIPMPGEQAVLTMPTGPADRLEECAIAFTDVIAQARKRLWIVSPYFVPDLDTRTALYGAALRGVDVRILLPHKPDHIMVWLASNAHANTMIEHGISVYRYSAGFLHQKVILMDDRIAGVGTVNFDNRSFNINFEVTLWFTHQQMIGDVTGMLETDFGLSRKMTVEEVAKEPFVKRFIGQAAKLLSPIL